MEKTDLITRIENAGPDGQSKLVWEAFRRLDPEAPPVRYLRYTKLHSLGAFVDAALMLLEEPWFVYCMGEQVSPILYKGGRRDRMYFHADLQHREGGRRTQGVGQTQALALLAAILKAKGPRP